MKDKWIQVTSFDQLMAWLDEPVLDWEGWTGPKKWVTNGESDDICGLCFTYSDDGSCPHDSVLRTEIYKGQIVCMIFPKFKL